MDIDMEMGMNDDLDHFLRRLGTVKDIHTETLVLEESFESFSHRFADTRGTAAL